VNIKPTKQYGELSRPDRALRRLNDGAHQIFRGLAIATVNTVLAPQNLIRKIRGEESNWFAMRTLHQRRVDLRSGLDADDGPPAQGRPLITRHAVERDIHFEQEVDSASASRPDSFDNEDSEIHIEPSPFIHLAPDAEQPKAPVRSFEKDSIDFNDLRQTLADMGVDEGALSSIKKMNNKTFLYFAPAQDKNVAESEFRHGFQINSRGRELLAAYYGRKYDAKIIFPEDELGKMSSLDFPDHIADLIAPFRQETGDVRCVFYIEGSHSIPVAYIKENGKELIVVADSKGGKTDDLADQIANALTYQNVRDVKVFRVATPRQADLYSCYTDAMKFAVLVTGRRKNEHTGDFEEFLIPELGEQLSARRVQSDAQAESPNVDSVLLPNEFLRLAQLTKFVDGHLDKATQDSPLHGDKKGRTWNEFKMSYQETFTTADGVTKPRADYLRQKGEQYARLVEIEYYNDQLKKLLGEHGWPVHQQNELVGRLKELARSHK
jgi:hypothetical protein